ncbi:MAG TPA: general secretion pathway protein GspD, partial [Rhodocyclaceae bacterium]|nr:general secretion pathway protein GspD [Rhodocyclaceae bacterium]
AATLFRQVQAIDPSNPRAAVGVREVEFARRHQLLVRQAEGFVAGKKPEQALATLRTVLAENPAHAGANSLMRRIEGERHQGQLTPPPLAPSLKKPITLQFKDASISEVFQALAKVSGLSFVFDKDVPTEAKVTLFANKLAVDDALTVLLTTSGLEKKVLGETTLLIYPNNPGKKAVYQENIVKSFYIGNADPKQTMNLVKTMVKSRDVFIDEKLGLLTVRDSLENIRIVERLIAAQDLQESEVLLEVEVLEIATSRLQSLGIQYPGQLGLTPFSTNPSLIGTVAAGATPYSRATTTLRELGSSRVLATLPDPSLVLNLRATDGQSNLLANPRIRVKNREKAKVRIGDKVPVITTTTVATGVSTESVQYLDVGLALDVDPVVHPDNQVSMKLALEVSNVVKEITSKSGLLTYQIGTRRAETVLRLKDGETQILAGLIRREERENAAKIPGLGDIPGLSRIFGSRADNIDKTEIVLLVTPHIVRRTELPPVHITEFASGSDNYVSTSPLRLQATQKLNIAPVTGAGNAVASAEIQPNPMSEAGVAITFAMTAPQRTAIGQTIDWVINANFKKDVRNLEIELDFDTTKFEYVSARVGPLMGSSGGTPKFESGVSGGRARIAVQNPGGARGSGELATITLRAKGVSSEPVWLGLGGVQAMDVAGTQMTIMAPEPKGVVISP